MHLELYLFWGDEGGLIDATRTWLDDAYAREIALTHMVHFANYGLKQLITSMVLLLFTTRVFITARRHHTIYTVCFRVQLAVRIRWIMLN